MEMSGKPQKTSKPTLKSSFLKKKLSVHEKHAKMGSRPIKPSAPSLAQTLHTTRPKTTYNKPIAA